jgi:chemotaxis regulatin CheY-phosphate phosphatase CheZ
MNLKTNIIVVNANMGMDFQCLEVIKYVLKLLDSIVYNLIHILLTTVLNVKHNSIQLNKETVFL